MELHPAATRRWTWLVAGSLLAITSAVYLPSIDGAFVLDDVTQVRDPLVLRPFDAGALAWLKSWRPVTSATFAFNFASSGLATRGWHVTNVLIHLVAVLLVWRLARVLLARARVERPEGPSLAVAAIFALHPLQTEAVSYVVQRGESLASALYLGALLVLFEREEAEGAWRRGWLLAAAIGLHVLGLLTKPIAATLPAAWLLIAAVLPPRADEPLSPWRRMARRMPESAPLFAISLASAILTVRATAGLSHSGYDIPGVSAAQYLATQMRVIPTYIRLLFWPADQSADWTFPFSPGLLHPPAVAGAIFLCLLAGGALWLALRAERLEDGPRALARLSGFGIPFFLLALAPSSSVVPLLDPIAEHRVYLPAFGLIVVVVPTASLALHRLFENRARTVGILLTIAVAATLGAATARRNAVWTGVLALYQDAALKSPDKARVQANLGLGLAEIGRHEEAVACYRRAIQLAADHTVEPGKMLQNLVASLMALGRVGEALQELDAYRLKRPNDPRALGFHGYVLFALSDRTRGFAEVQQAVAAAPRDADLLGLLAWVSYEMGRDAEAVGAARAALGSDTGSRTALRVLGMSSARLGDLPTARGAFRALAGLGGADAQLLLQLGNVEQGLGNRDGACRAYTAAVSVPADPVTSGLARSAGAQLGCR